MRNSTFPPSQVNKEYRRKRIPSSLYWLTLLWLAGACAAPAKQPVAGSQIRFSKQVLLAEFIAEGVAAGDVNRDGRTDILAGAYWFEAPNWQKHELAKPEKFYYDKGYSNAFISQTLDVNLDGWLDFVRIGFPGQETQWFENPGKKTGHWPLHRIHDQVGNESAGFYDVDGDGRLDLLGGNSAKGQMTWFRAPTTKGQTAWETFPISAEKAPGSAPFSHGLGMGDVNQDGRPDVIIREGWWEAPADPRQPNWTFHAANLGEPCSQMYAHDLDQDGDQDVLAASAHLRGIWWYEQTGQGGGAPAWQRHLISDQYTQTHAVAFTDMNDDGHPDFVTGKRYFAHMGKDPGEYESPVLYWYEFKPGPQPSWQAHQVDADSGVGVQVLVEDISKDGLKDIIVANKKGVFFFKQERR